MSKNTRSTRCSDDWLLGEGLSNSLSGGRKLPHNLIVLKRFLFIRHENKNMVTRDAFKKIFEELKEIWQRAYLPMKAENKCLDQLMSLHKEWSILGKIELSRREKPATLSRIEKFKDKMNQLCDFSPKDVLEKLKSKRYKDWQENYSFLLRKRQFPQVGYIHGVDRLMVEKEKRLNKQQPRLSNTAVKAISENVNLDESQEESTSSEINCDSTTRDTAIVQNPMKISVNRSSSSSRPGSVTLEMNTNLIAKQTGTVVLSHGLSIRDHVSMQASFVKAGGGNVDDKIFN
jgi:hypothetical protein